MSDRNFLNAELSGLELLLNDIPASDVFNHHAMQGRLEQVREELEALDGPVVSQRASIKLVLNDGPVSARGAEAKFAGEALAKFEDLVVASAKDENAASTVEVAEPSKPPRSRRRPPKRRLEVTGTFLGSFGFQLEEVEVGAPTNLIAAVDNVVNIVAAAGRSEDALAEALTNASKQTSDALSKFLKHLEDNKASLKLVADEQAVLGVEQVKIAAGRARDLRVEEDVIRDNGVNEGILWSQRTFEFTKSDGETIGGKIASSVDDQTVRLWHARLHRVPCTAVIGHKRVTRRGKMKDTYTLRWLAPIDAAIEGLPAEPTVEAELDEEP